MSVHSTRLLEIRSMTIWRGDHLLLDEMSLCVDSGSVVQIQGTNGTGKTTFLRAILGLAEIDEGEVLWKGRPLRQVRDELYASLVYLGHKSGISSGLTPLENLRTLCPELAADARETVFAVLDELMIADRIDLPAAALSAGQQRRVSLARLRLQQAELWVLDEPLTSLDNDGCQWVQQEIVRHVSAGGSVVFTTHQPMQIVEVPVHSVTLGAEP